ncbi:uncharacterized protein B0P05DRAFT_470063 [Gilbertella persicaria]|uniref:uncharacterized protein n=1 Tax=Gilbertella persicaria TaxID=101096 RepID=UPI00221EF3EE|nr:uncharacterized protein B0P05DRAFT_470063 [Gilbertella persicaria]KAI8079678.1 hypothetical protein B0P05DRAFT_470063 [Gilbertella persicaria]
MHLKQFLCLEQQLNKLFDQSKYCIFRTPLWHQFFFYLGPMMDDENAIQLPIGEHTKWQTIDLADLVDAVYRLSLPGKRDENKTLFEFTLDHNMTSKEIVEAAQKGLDQQIKFKQVDPNVFKDYLKRMHHDNRFKKRPFSGSDRPYTFPLGQYLHHETIETLVEWFELMEQEEIKPTSDLQDAIETRPQSIQDFFKQNRNQFRRLR